MHNSSLIIATNRKMYKWEHQEELVGERGRV